jgi:hypothetical protein
VNPFEVQSMEDAGMILSSEFSTEIIFDVDDSVDPPMVDAAYGIFDETYLEVDPDTGASVMSQYPRVTIHDSNLPEGFSQGDQVTIKGKTYKARTIEPDGQGMIQVKLHG